MNKYDKEIETFKTESKREYFKMQMEEDKKRKILYSSAIILMIFLPLLIVSYRNYKKFNQIENNKTRVRENKKELETLASNFLLNSEFLSSLTFQDGNAKVYLMDIYNGKYKDISLPVYFDKNYTHQCLGYLISIKNANTYEVDINDYCKM
jgi:hypothetical protein